MAEMSIEGTKELYRIHSSIGGESIWAPAPDMLIIMEWCLLHRSKLEEEARKMNRRLEKRNRK